MDATFFCQHPTDSGTIEWIINGTRFRGASSNDMIVIEGRGNATEGLKMRSLPQFNGTKVVCVLYIIEPNGTVTVDRSTPAILTVQGTNVIINAIILYTLNTITIKFYDPEINVTWLWTFGGLGGRGGEGRRINWWLSASISSFVDEYLL